MSKFDTFTREELLEIVKKQEGELVSKKYGLVWDSEREPEQVVLDCVHKLPVLKRVKGKAVSSPKGNTSNDNILIEGDNYHALTVLNYTHSEKIDVIYIDPPYNTGSNDFMYNDRFVDREDGFRHSKWLNFMEKRLKLAHGLLKDTGVIFISIDDNEQAQLRLLCDQVFGQDNFLANVVRKSKETSNKGKYFSPSTDYVLSYAKDINSLPEFNNAEAQQEEKYIKLFKYEDERGKYNIVSLYMPSLDPRPNQRYFITCPDGSKVTTPVKEKMFRWIPSTFEKNLKDNRVVFLETKTSPLIDEKGEKSKWNIYTKIYLHERQELGMKPLTFIDIPNSAGSKELIKMGISFSFSKPKELISHLIRITNKSKNITILDFMAGSGTTGQAVLELNKEDGGSRSFILCTNNENNICEAVTYPRLEKVIKGYKKNGNGESVTGLGGNLQYFKTDFVTDSKSKDQMRLALTHKCTEMLCVKEGIFKLITEAEGFKIFVSNDDTAYLCVYYNIDDESAGAFNATLKKLSGTKKVYLFSADDTVDTTVLKGVPDCTVEAIPQNIIDVYAALVKMNIPVTAEIIHLEFEKAKERVFVTKDKDEGARILRIVLEKTIQKITQKSGKNILKENHKEEKIALLNDVLKNEGVFTKIQWEENKTYLTIGNQAAHGEYTEYTLVQVKNFYRHVQSLFESFGI